MTSQPDKLFRDRLENFSRPAPAPAWDKIEASLDKPSTSGLWLKIAAGLVLLAVATILLWPADRANNNRLTDSTIPKTEPKNKNSIPENNPIVTEAPPAVQEKADRKTIYKKIKRPEVNKKEETPLVAQSTNDIMEEENQITRTDEVAQAISEEVKNQSEGEMKATSRTIVYTADEVNAKFLKKVLPVEATSDEKKSSQLQKLMGLAYNLKNTETGLGDLRQKKNEMLALNFRDKKEGQN